jgi:hypothetical protein
LWGIDLSPIDGLDLRTDIRAKLQGVPTADNSRRLKIPPVPNKLINYIQVLSGVFGVEGGIEYACGLFLAKNGPVTLKRLI